MSFRAFQKTTMTNMDWACEASKKLGFPVTAHAEEVSLKGYGSERLGRKAKYVIHRENHSGVLGADIGFLQEADGSISVTSDNYANRNFDQYMKDLDLGYKEQSVMSKAKGLIQLGKLRVVGRNEKVVNGKKQTVLQFAAK